LKLPETKSTKKAVFLDRDGTLNIDTHGYIKTPEEFELFPYAARAVALINKMDFQVIVVTNQSGVARGYYTPADVEAIHHKMLSLIAEEGGVIDKVYYSPYHIDGTVEPFNVESDCRKPKLGMFREAVREFGIRPELSWMIGDKYSDIEFGKNAGMKSILLLCGLGQKEFFEERQNWKVMPDFIVSDLLAAVQLINSLESK
jgi:D,D-heptose 1,7-bisphosphate phosphatase